jgi:hypothetical protein
VSSCRVRFPLHNSRLLTQQSNVQSEVVTRWLKDRGVADMVKYFRSLLVFVQPHQNAAMLRDPSRQQPPPAPNLRYKPAQTIHLPSHIARAIRLQIILENESSVSKAWSSPCRLELADLLSVNEKSPWARSRSGFTSAPRTHLAQPADASPCPRLANRNPPVSTACSSC